MNKFIQHFILYFIVATVIQPDDQFLHQNYCYFFFRFINYYHVPYIWNDSINFFFFLDSYNISSLSFLVALFPSTRLAFFETTWAFHLFFNSTFITHNVNCLSVYPVCSWNGAYSLFCKSHLFNFAYGNCIPGMCWHCDLL
jgi:hypothetical protein